MNGPAFLTLNPIQWTTKIVVDAVHWVAGQAEQLDTAIRIGNGRVMELNRKIAGVQDAAQREQMRAAVQRWVHNQAQLVASYREFVRRWTQGLNRARALMARLGFAPNTLGQAETITLAVIAGVLITVAGYVISLQMRTSAQRKGLDMIHETVDKWSKGQLNETQAKTLLDSIAHNQDKATPPDPFGLGAALDKALPLVAILGAVLILPPLLESFRGMRRRVAA